MTKDIAALKTDAAPAMRKRPEIDPANVKTNTSGFARRDMFVRLPKGMIADDLKERGIWRRCQNSQSHFIRQHDSLLLVAFEQDWIAECFVAYADSAGVDLVGIRIMQTPQRTKQLYADDLYRVRWNGVGYYAERIADGHAMTQTTATAGAAERDLIALYPRRVGAY